MAKRMPKTTRKRSSMRTVAPLSQVGIQPFWAGVIMYILLALTCVVLWFVNEDVQELVNIQMTQRMGKGWSEAIKGVLWFFHTLWLVTFLSFAAGEWIRGLSLKKKEQQKRHRAAGNWFVVSAFLMVLYLLFWFQNRGFAAALAVTSLIGYLLIKKNSDPLEIR